MKAHSTSDAARFAAVFTALLLLAVPVALAADAADPQARPAGLEAASGSLDARATAATLELYSLEAQLGRARTQLAGIRADRRALTRRAASARTQLAVAKGAVAASQIQLEELVLALYQQPGSDPLAIVLGASSLDEALTALDGISRAAGRNDRIIEQARAATLRLEELKTRLAERARQLDRLAAAAEAKASALAAASARRQRYVAALRKQQGLKAARIASIEAQARAAGAATVELADAGPAAEPPAPVDAASAPAAAAPAAGPGALTVTVTGYSIRGRTATGIPTAPGVVAVDPSVIPLGTRLTIPGYGGGVAADTGGAVQGQTIDVWFPTHAQALAWGRRTITITLH